MNLKRHRFFSSIVTAYLVLGMVFIPPFSWAQDASTQGENQGANQGTDQGGPTLESLGVTPDENGNYDTSSLGSSDPRAGANQGDDQGTQNGTTPTPDTSSSNTNTGANSDNNSSSSTSQTNGSQTNNTGNVSNTGTGSASTGQNSSSQNTGSGGVGTGDAGVTIQQVTTDNLNTTGTSGEIQHTTTAGTQDGDIVLSFDPNQSGQSLGQSFISTNSVTGANSGNSATIESNRTQLNEIQNDGQINNTLSASAITGQNTAEQNTGNALISTGNANIAATLINFLNTNIIDSYLWMEVMDVIGNLNGDIVIPSSVLALLSGNHPTNLAVNTSNENTGSGSQNNANVNINNTENTSVTNDAEVQNNIDINATTGQNTATQNTGNSTIETGDVEASANTVTLANTTVEDGSLGIIIVNALNKWLGFLVGQDNSLTPIDHEYTTALVAQNSQTGADSVNDAEITVNNTETNSVENNGKITNNLLLEAVTGQNTANQNTGNAQITTGDARVQANVVNVVNTNVVRGNLFVAVVNIFGDWMGDLIFGDQNITTLATTTGTGEGTVAVTTENSNTGENSSNDVNVDVNSSRNTDIANDAKIENNLHVNADTGHNETNRNTGLGSIKTGDAIAALHARNLANLTSTSVSPFWSDITAVMNNSVTGADSQNTIDVTVNDERNINITNDAQVDTAMGAIANTGFNTANRNTLGGIIDTGIAQAIAFVENLLNQTWLTGGAGGGTTAINGSNNSTGSGSTNTTNFATETDGSANIANNADVNNEGNLDTNSGNNQANDNTGDGTASTGSADVVGGAQNTVNQTELAGNPLNLDINQDNTATIDNNFTGNANTGGNETNDNTGTNDPADDNDNGGGDNGGGTGGGDTGGGQGNNGTGTTGNNSGSSGGSGGGGSGGNGGGTQKTAIKTIPSVKGATESILHSEFGIGYGGDGNYYSPLVKEAKAEMVSIPKTQTRFPVAPLIGTSTRSLLKLLPWILLVTAGALVTGIYLRGNDWLFFVLENRRTNT